MGKRSNMFANIENEFEFATKDEIISTTFDSLQQLLDAIEAMGDAAILSTLVLGVQLGIAGKSELNLPEKELVDCVFGEIWTGPIEPIYKLICKEITDAEYDRLKLLVSLGNHIAMPFLRFVLSFAYIDGYFEDDVAERLDGLFGMNLLAEFIQSGKEDVPSPRIKLTGLEAEIYQWFKEDDDLKPLDAIISHFY